MKKMAFLGLIGLFALTVFTCESIGGLFQSSGSSSASRTASTAAASASSVPFFTGDGGRGMSLAVLVPAGSGLAAEQNYLPTLVQGVLVGDLSKYSAITVLDRVKLETVLKETESGIYSSDADFGQLGEIAEVDYALTGNITRTGAGYAVQIQVVGTGRDSIGITKASHSGSFTIAELDDFTGIRKVSLDLLDQMGVRLTDAAKRELSGAAAANQVNAETALARGITAQRQGTEVAALSYYLQAAALDPSILEAANRSSVLSTDISSGNIGESARNDIAWRNAWIARLRETEEWFSSAYNDFIANVPPAPFTLYYTGEIKRKGAIDYRNETINFQDMEAFLEPSPEWEQSVRAILQSMQHSVDAVLEGLDATKRKGAWGLGNWPQASSFDLRTFEIQNKAFEITAELVNSNGQVIGRATFTTGGEYNITAPIPGESKLISFSTVQGVNSTNVPEAVDKTTFSFSNVNVNDITDSLTVRIANVREGHYIVGRGSAGRRPIEYQLGAATDAETAVRSGVLQIKAIPKNQYGLYSILFTSRSRPVVLVSWDWDENSHVNVQESIFFLPADEIMYGYSEIRAALSNALVRAGINNSNSRYIVAAEYYLRIRSAGTGLFEMRFSVSYHAKVYLFDSFTDTILSHDNFNEMVNVRARNGSTYDELFERGANSLAGKINSDYPAILRRAVR